MHSCPDAWSSRLSSDMKASKQPSIFPNLQIAQTMSSGTICSPSSYHIQSEEIRHLSPMAVSNVSGPLFPRMEYVEISQKCYLFADTFFFQLLHKQVMTRTNSHNPAE